MQAQVPQYFLVINGKPEGPFTVQQLKEHHLKPGDFIKTAAMPDYKEAAEIPELRALFGFEKEVLLQYFAGFDQRLTAAAIDLFLVALVCVVPVFLAVLLLGGNVLRLLLTFAPLAIIPLTNLVYHIVMESSVKQGTYGKQLLKIKVCDMHGERLTPLHAIGRNLAKILSVATLGVGYLFSFFNKQQQCLHDRVAGSLVVKSRLF
jgi:uncharacterized RDD family membrane protein YckC